jgi:phage-related protein
MAVIDQIVAHYNATKDQFVEVPEWGVDGVPLKIYFKRLTPLASTELFKNAVENVDIVISRALDADGNKMFTLEHKQTLRRNADSSVIARIAAEMVKSTPAEVAEKN